MELYSIIHDLVFKLPPSRRPRDAIFIYIYDDDPPEMPDTVFVDRNYKPPQYLQLNRATRNENARRYYGTTYFVMMDADCGFLFLRSLSTEFRDMLGRFALRCLAGPAFKLIEYVEFKARCQKEFGNTLKSPHIFCRGSPGGRDIMQRLEKGYRTPFW